MAAPAARSVEFDLVVPTVGRPSLATLLDSLAACDGPLPERVILVDDRAEPGPPIGAGSPARLAARVVVVESGGRGPAAARNAGWRRATAPWVAFVDDDVVLPPTWLTELQRDLLGLTADIAASQGRIQVPLPSHRRPTDWERNVAGLERARWATADMAYRRDVLERVHGFDERFPRAYREDADLGLRVCRAGYRIVRGRRAIVHPVRPADGRVSLRLQAGNADDPFMAALHGRGWRQEAGVPRGRRPWHLATTSAAVAAVTSAVARRSAVASLAACLWAGLTADLAWRRIAPGPRSRDEVVRMVGTSVVLPFTATWHWLRGVVTLPVRLRRPGPEPSLAPDPTRSELPAAVLFDRDGTLVHDVPYNGDPAAVRPVQGARQALDLVRSLGIPVAIVSNQSGIGRGLVSTEQVAAVNRRLDDLLGPFAAVEVCAHAPEDGCRCRKPGPLLIEQACHRLGVDPARCVVIGDIGADVEAAHAAGARAVLVPTPVTRPEEIASAPAVGQDLAEAVELALGRVPAAGGAT